MEGTYFFGEHLRWNLGWSNPNQAGAFIAMWIPWLWACLRWTSCRSNKITASCWLLLVAELVLWFLVCKTYSRGALVAVGVAGGIFYLWERLLNGGATGRRLMVARLAGIGFLLVATGFFSRIDPRFVGQDASTGNRLVLWKGGLQMIAASPWSGWGAGGSGTGFMHWFQPLESKQEYAGMVNSYLHVGVEYGLPVLSGAMALLLAMVLAAFLPGLLNRPPASVKSDSEGRAGWRWSCFAAAAGSSLLVFLIANVFSTLWIFKNLWWLPAAAGLEILITGFCAQGKSVAAVYDGRNSVAAVYDRRCLSAMTLITALCAQGWRFIKFATITVAASSLLSVLFCLILYTTGKTIPSDVAITLSPDRNVVTCRAGQGHLGEVLFFPDRTVLGKDWGKEIRRLAAAPKYHDFEFLSSVERYSGTEGARSGASPKFIVACGAQSPRGFAALSRWPASQLIVVHPLGKPVPPENMAGEVAVMLPLLDTGGSGRSWRAICKKREWQCLTSPGVGQDVRLVWPDALNNAFRD